MAADSSSSMSGFQPEAVGAGDGANDGGGGSAGGGVAQGGGGGSAGGRREEEGEDSSEPLGSDLGDAPGYRYVPQQFAHSWRAGADGRDGPPVPVGFQLSEQYQWQVGMGYDTWMDVDQSWNQPLFEALRRGVPEIRLVYTSHSVRYEALHRWYTIDFTNRTWTTQENVRTGTRRPLRVVQVVNPTPRCRRPPPSSVRAPAAADCEQPTVSAGPAPTGL